MTRQTQDEWTWRHNGHVEFGQATHDRAETERLIGHVREVYPGDDVALVHRAVTDWQDVTEGEVAR